MTIHKFLTIDVKRHYKFKCPANCRAKFELVWSRFGPAWANLGHFGQFGLGWSGPVPARLGSFGLVRGRCRASLGCFRPVWECLVLVWHGKDDLAGTGSNVLCRFDMSKMTSLGVRSSG